MSVTKEKKLKANTLSRIQLAKVNTQNHFTLQ